MTDPNNTSNFAGDATPPPTPPAASTVHGTAPIPPARINRDQNLGRIGPVVNVPIPTNLVGRPDYSRAPGLDMTKIAPRQRLDNDEHVDDEDDDNTVVDDVDEGTSDNASFFSSIFSMFRPGTSSSSATANTTTAAKTDKGKAPAPAKEVDPESDALEASSLLSTRLPPELVPDILDHASYFPHAVLASSTTPTSVSDGDKVYLTATIPDFPALDETTAGRGGAEGAGGRAGRVRRLVFRLRSRDQGWSSFPEDEKTYRGAWSWLDVELWRRQTADDTATTTQDTTTSSLTTSLITPPNSANTTTENNDEDPDPADAPGHTTDGDKELLGTWLLQRNVHAELAMSDHTIIWDYQVDELPDSADEKWEDNTINENGHRDRWHRGGRIANGEFIRMLKGGDEIRVVMKARFPGWSCNVNRCEVECWWAV